MNEKGFSLVEVILSITLFSLFTLLFFSVLVQGREATVAAGDRAQAVFLAQEGLEAVRNMRDDAFSNVAIGTHGLSAGSQWSLSGSSDVVGEFTRSLNITSIDADTVQVDVTVDWQQDPRRSGSVTLTSYFTHWREGVSAASCNAFAVAEGYTSGTCRQNARQCERNGEIPLPDGDVYCTDPGRSTCCALE